MTALSTSPAPRPQWRDEYFRDASALLEHCEQMRAWQCRSDDPFERADIALWSQVSAAEAWSIFFQLKELFNNWDACGELDAALLAENDARLVAGAPTLSMFDFRVTLARILFHQEILRILPAAEA